jgi:hypothetical protein
MGVCHSISDGKVVSNPTIQMQSHYFFSKGRKNSENTLKDPYSKQVQRVSIHLVATCVSKCEVFITFGSHTTKYM